MTMILIVTLFGVSSFAFRFGYWPFLVATTVSVSFTAVMLVRSEQSDTTFWTCVVGSTSGIAGSLIAMLADTHLREREPFFVTNIEYQNMFFRSAVSVSVTFVLAGVVGAALAILINYAKGNIPAAAA